MMLRETSPLNNLEDHQLLEKARRNDMQAIAMIHDRYYPKIWGYVCYRISNKQICEDISADVFMRFLGQLKNTKNDINHLGGWLLGTANHLVMDYYRDAYKKPLSDLENHTEMKVKGSTQEHVEHSIRVEELKSQLRNLTPEQQHVLSLRFSQEFSLEETARVMQKSVGSVKLLQHRAVESLRKQFEKKGWV